ncbi:hypothetical protein B0H63DRAFT_492155 [Podospora didyma]|uniref:Uncharacterized protein n=1 Tax=Podospora didyma TaxID=330526 RepID=A0AAE0P893_9PEZI|nr:hypothetical protein B0H63DRAFT_492155 [Podospora didyma]
MDESLKCNRLFAVDGLVAVITGGGSGLGLMMAMALAENGASKVYIVGRRENKLREAAASYPDILVPLPGDVTSQDSLQAMAQRVRQEKVTSTCFLAKVYQFNCAATYYTVLALLELLSDGNKRRESDAPHSQVIVTSNMVAFQRDPRYGFAYLGSKAALVRMVKSFATLVVGWETRFNTIAPGLFPSDLSAAALAPFKRAKDKDLSEEGAFARSFLPAERAGSVQDMAGALLYLASRAGAYVNGSVLLVGGGKKATTPATY